MKVSIDGGRTWIKLNEEVRIVYRRLTMTDGNGKEHPCQLHIVATPEDLVMDVWENRKTNRSVPSSSATSSETAQEIVGRMTKQQNGHKLRG